MTEVSVSQLIDIIGELYVQNTLLRAENERLRQALVQTASESKKTSELGGDKQRGGDLEEH